MTSQLPDIITKVNPIPHTVINRTPSAWSGFGVMMILWGFVWGWANALAGYAYWHIYRYHRVRQSAAKKALWDLVTIFIALPIFAFLSIIPSCGAWIFAPIVAQVCSL